MLAGTVNVQSQAPSQRACGSYMILDAVDGWGLKLPEEHPWLVRCCQVSLLRHYIKARIHKQMLQQLLPEAHNSDAQKCLQVRKLCPKCELQQDCL